FMLPLTVYIAVCNPVSDCGCFGDFIVISNTATLIKNIVLVALIIFLIFRNRRVPGVYPAPIQWLVIAASLAYPLLLAMIGFNIQPLVDFRPYKVGTAMFGDSYDDSGDTYYIYEKDGEQRSFSLAALPDSSWTFVDTAESPSQSVSGAFEIRDSNGNSMNDILASDTPAIYLIIPEPDMSFLSYIHYANAICEQTEDRGIASAALVGSAGDALDEWIGLMQPRFDVYSAEDTSLKQLARGDAALVFIDNDGIIQWKRSLASIHAVEDMPEDIEAIDDGRLNIYILSAYLASMLVIYFLSLSPKILTLFTRHKEKNA
ncbi:MAG: hypothetical protein K2K22_07670, partial [Muribaculaceae bacterium]|nr:hypothetical protein [Muribaculaceae bacterium]